MGGFVFSLAVDVYQSFPSLYHISGLALPYGSLDSLTRLAVLSYLRIAVLCGLDRRCLWISPLLCDDFSKRMATSRSCVEPCRMAISVACHINRLFKNKTLNRNRNFWSGAPFPNWNARMCRRKHFLGVLLNKILWQSLHHLLFIEKDMLGCWTNNRKRKDEAGFKWTAGWAVLKKIFKSKLFSPWF